MSEPAKELELEPQGGEPEPSKEASWFFNSRLPETAPAEEKKEPSAEAPKTEEPAPAVPPPSAPAQMAPPAIPQAAAAPPPEFMQYIQPFVQQQAATNATLQQIAQLQMQQMMPPPQEIPKPDPIEQPEAFAQYMFQQQFEPIRRQTEDLARNQMFLVAEQKRKEMAMRHPDFEIYAPAIYQQANQIPLPELAKDGTWEYIFRATRDFIKENMPHLVPDSGTPQTPKPSASPKTPAAREAAPNIPSGTMGGGAEGQPKMTQKFINQCRKVGQDPAEVLAFAIKDGIKPEDLME